MKGAVKLVHYIVVFFVTTVSPNLACYLHLGEYGYGERARTLSTTQINAPKIYDSVFMNESMRETVIPHLQKMPPVPAELLVPGLRCAMLRDDTYAVAHDHVIDHLTHAFSARA